MKTDRIRRAGVLALAVVGLFAVSWVLPPAVHKARRLCPVRPDGVPETQAYASFARRYGVDCSVCHISYPQLSEVGAKFRMAGYRMPDEIGNEAKWTNWGDNTSVKLVETYKVAASVTGTGAAPATNGFVNSGVQWYPLEGAFGKYMAANDEVDFNAGSSPTKNINTSNTSVAGTPGSMSVSNAHVVATLPINADSFVTVRAGLMNAFNGYGASDSRGVGAVSPTFKPTPSQLQPGAAKSFTYSGFAAGGEGVEVGFNWKDTHVSAQITNGYNSYNNTATQGEDNRYKDFSVFVNQFIGENAIAAHFYNGTAGYGNNTGTLNNGTAGAEAAGAPYSANWYDNYVRGIIYGTMKFLPSDKLNLLVGFCDGVDHTYDLHTNNAGDQFHSMGWFATAQSIQHVLNQQLTTALSYGTNRASTSTAGNRVSDVTLSFAVPVQNNKFDFSMQSRRSQQLNSPDTIANVAQAQWEYMF
jgi:hypothetical protein